MDKPMTKNTTKMRDRIRVEARHVYDELDENIKLMYTTEQCQMCGAHLTIRQLNRVIIEGVPPICLKHYKQMKGEMEQLMELFGQMSLL